MHYVDFKMILTKMICLVNEKDLPKIYKPITSEITTIDDLRTNKSVLLSKFNPNRKKRMGMLISLVTSEYKDSNDNDRNFLEIYDLLDLFEFIVTISKAFDLKLSDNWIMKQCHSYDLITTFMENIDQWISSSKLDKWVGKTTLKDKLKDLFSYPKKLENIEYWIRIEAYNFISSIYNEIEDLTVSDLNFNPYVLLLFNFETLDEAIYLPYDQTISRKLSGKWGLVGENILRHNYAVRSELREFDLLKYVSEDDNDRYTLYHYEIKSMPAGTMRGAEEKKFFERVIPGYQAKPRYNDVGFMLGGLYQSKRASTLDKKVKRMIDQNKDIKFIAYPRVVIGGSQLWFEFTRDKNFFYKLKDSFKEVAAFISRTPGRGSIIDFIANKREELLDELKAKHSGLNSIIDENL